MGGAARKAGLPQSKFVIQIVEDALVEESEIKPPAQLVKEISRLRPDNKQLFEMKSAKERSLGNVRDRPQALSH
ncbi:MAG: hypothetical protein LUQ38_03685 [Methanotrichaceae archaeon]|nr:hypothetical protein [Methanotrichaceae archaeon]